MKECEVCSSTTGLVFTREMKPGARGGMGQSFAGCYILCYDCLEICRQIGALIGLQTMNAAGKKIEPRAKVTAKTLKFLRSRRA